MSSITDFDKAVGKVSGAIYNDIVYQFPHSPLMLIPAITFKVRKTLEQIADINFLSATQKAQLARDIQVAIIPMLFSYEIDADVIEKITPTIELAALKALTQGL